MEEVWPNGSYFVCTIPLLLKPMPTFFDFGNDKLYKTPMWIKLHNLPLELWSETSLSRILSAFGKPLCTGMMTATKQSLSFAHALVEVDATRPRVKTFCFRLPNGSICFPVVEYESIPKFCTKCKMVGPAQTKCTMIYEEGLPKVMHEIVTQAATKGGPVNQ